MSLLVRLLSVWCRVGRAHHERLRQWLACAACLMLAVSLHPQIARAQTGALFLLVPFGARAIGLGEAISADTALASEGIWWNAAALARMDSKEIAVHHSQTVLSTSDMLTLTIPSARIGTLALGAYLVNYGDQLATDDNSGQPIGVITNRNYLLAASYGTPVGKRLSLGVTYKFIMLRFACSGVCGNTPVLSGSSSAIDIGAQYQLPTAFPAFVGGSIRNLGPALQVKDKDQADPLPRIVQVGVKSRLPVDALTEAGASLDLSADVVSAAALGSFTFGIGAALGYQDTFFLRGGYKQQEGLGSGPSIGIGAQKGAISIDFSRRFDQLSSQLGETPTYISLRARF